MEKMEKMKKLKMLKKLMYGLLVLSMFMSILASSTYASTNQAIKVIVDGKQVDFPDARPFINEDGRTVVPLRFVSENLGSRIDWVPATQSVVIKMEGKDVKLKIGERRAHIIQNGLTGGVVFDTKAIIKESRTFVPLRFVSEMLGSKVEWDGKTRTVKITTGIKDTAQYDDWGRKIRTTNLPKNAKDYPYILNEIPNAMYEMKYPKVINSFMNSAQLYKEIPEFNAKNANIWMEKVRKHYDIILNVDYRTIDENKFVIELYSTVNQSTNEEFLKKRMRDYVKWVKTNQIIIEGWLEPEPSMIVDVLPAYYVRSQYEFKIISAKRNEKLLYDQFADVLDVKKGQTYRGFFDVKIGTNVGGDWGTTLTVSNNNSFTLNNSLRLIKELE